MRREPPGRSWEERHARPLRGSGAEARGDAGGDPQGLSQARQGQPPGPAPGRQGRRGALQGAVDRQRDPCRSGEARPLRQGRDRRERCRAAAPRILPRLCRGPRGRALWPDRGLRGRGRSRPGFCRSLRWPGPGRRLAAHAGARRLLHARGRLPRRGPRSEKTINTPDGRTLQVTIPVGVRDRQTLRLKGMGGPGLGGGSPATPMSRSTRPRTPSSAARTTTSTSPCPSPSRRRCSAPGSRSRP